MDNDIDVGYYDPPKIIIDTIPVIVDFYRISIKIKYKRKSTPNLEPVSAVFFNTGSDHRTRLRC
jgi:AraC family transcriptional activator of pobA